MKKRQDEPGTLYRVQCKADGTPAPWLDYSTTCADRASAEECKARAEARRTYNQNGRPIIYSDDATGRIIESVQTHSDIETARRQGDRLLYRLYH